MAQLKPPDEPLFAEPRHELPPHQKRLSVRAALMARSPYSLCSRRRFRSRLVSRARGGLRRLGSVTEHQVQHLRMYTPPHLTLHFMSSCNATVHSAGVALWLAELLELFCFKSDV